MTFLCSPTLLVLCWRYHFSSEAQAKEYTHALSVSFLYHLARGCFFSISARLISVIGINHINVA